MNPSDLAVLITGATGRIGKVLSLSFASLGCELALTARDAKSASMLAEMCLRGGARRAIVVEVDLNQERAAEVITDELKSHAFRPTTLVNNARDRTNLGRQPDGTTSRSHWESELRLAVIVPYELTMRLAALSSSTLQSVINISSIYGINAPQLRIYDEPSQAPPECYGVSKAAQIHLSKELAVRLAPRIRVNAVSYGGVAGRTSDTFARKYSHMSPMGVMLNDSDLFGAVRFLALNESSAITGHNLIVDGGWTAW